MSMSWTEVAAQKIILDFYDDGDIWQEAAAFRVGTAHVETPLPNGDTTCEVCGVLQQPTAHPMYHPEQWVDDNGELLEYAPIAESP